MISPQFIPQRFQVAHKSPKFKKFVELEFTSGAAPSQWNGYYNEWRIMLRHTDLEWIVEAIFQGKHYAIFRWPRGSPGMAEIEVLVQCCCYYIDSTKGNEI